MSLVDELLQEFIKECVDPLPATEISAPETASASACDDVPAPPPPPPVTRRSPGRTRLPVHGPLASKKERHKATEKRRRDKLRAATQALLAELGDAAPRDAALHASKHTPQCAILLSATLRIRLLQEEVKHLKKWKEDMSKMIDEIRTP